MALARAAATKKVITTSRKFNVFSNIGMHLCDCSERARPCKSRAGVQYTRARILYIRLAGEKILTECFNSGFRVRTGMGGWKYREIYWTFFRFL